MVLASELGLAAGRSDPIGLAPQGGEVGQIGASAPEAGDGLEDLRAPGGRRPFQPVIHCGADNLALRTAGEFGQAPQALMLARGQIDLGSHHRLILHDVYL